MTDQEQRRADHLALVAAPIYGAYDHNDNYLEYTEAELVELALKDAERLQRAAEERVVKQ